MLEPSHFRGEIIAAQTDKLTPPKHTAINPVEVGRVSGSMDAGGGRPAWWVLRQERPLSSIPTTLPLPGPTGLARPAAEPPH